MRIGAHASAFRGISKAVGRGVEIGCETIQIFGSSPQSWAFKPIPDAEIEAFRQKAAGCRVDKRVLDHSPEGPYLCLENIAGMGQHIGAKFGQLGDLIKAVDNPRLRIYLDTQHSFAAGYELTTREGVNMMMTEFDEAIGLEKLAAVHANDSKQPRGSGVDRHDKIGEGLIGEAGFEAIMGHPAFRDVPFFLEVPGFEGKGPDQQNIEMLKDIRHRVGIDD